MYVDSLFGLRRALFESAQARLLCFVRTSVVWGKQTKTGQNGLKSPGRQLKGPGSGLKWPKIKAEMTETGHSAQERAKNNQGRAENDQGRARTTKKCARMARMKPSYTEISKKYQIGAKRGRDFTPPVLVPNNFLLGVLHTCCLPSSGLCLPLRRQV